MKRLVAQYRNQEILTTPGGVGKGVARKRISQEPFLQISTYIYPSFCYMLNKRLIYLSASKRGGGWGYIKNGVNLFSLIKYVNAAILKMID